MTIEWTGERFVPEVIGEVTYEHNLRYIYASKFVSGKKVLDLPSGEGYGSFALSKFASSVIGIDLSQEAVSHANSKYKKNNLAYEQASMADLKLFKNEEFDVVVSFEGIEHVDRELQILTLKEIRRVLKKDGLLLISSPNKKVYSDLRNYRNPYHLAEYYLSDMKNDLLEHFQVVDFLGQVNIFSSLLLKNETNLAALELYLKKFSDLGPSKFNIEDAMYFVAVCSNDAKDVGEIGLLDYSGEMVDELKMLHSQQVSHLEKRINDLEGFLKVSKNEIIELKNSNSWKITFPLRKIGSLVKKNSKF